MVLPCGADKDLADRLLIDSILPFAYAAQSGRWKMRKGLPTLKTANRPHSEQALTSVIALITCGGPKPDGLTGRRDARWAGRMRREPRIDIGGSHFQPHCV